MATVSALRDARTRRLLEAPILPTLVRLALPNILTLVALLAVVTVDGALVGSLGPDALAGVSLVFPLMMLMQQMAASGMGSGVASAVARALGAGQREEAETLAVHAVVIAIGMASLFTSSLLLGGPTLYRAIGTSGGALQAAITYSNVLFSCALAPWLQYTLSSIVRGTGNMMLPAAVNLGSATIHVVLLAALISGWGPFPRLGVSAAGIAVGASFGLGSLVLLGYLRSGRSIIRLPLGGRALRRQVFWEILRVGVPGSLNTVVTNLTIVIFTGLVGQFGPFALAGYGTGARLEYVQITLVVGFGSALVTMVATNIGAGQYARAKTIAWIGAGVAAAVSETIGLLAALFPHAWIGLFSDEPRVIAAAARYLATVGPFYGFFGMGLALYFALQGAGRPRWPLIANCARLVITIGGGWLAGHWYGGGLAAVFAAVAAAFVLYGSTIVAALKAGSWR
ncbi:MAG: MATE family efflux transporter [Candidatus Rokuibacteriota bacterium]